MGPYTIERLRTGVADDVRHTVILNDTRCTLLLRASRTHSTVIQPSYHGLNLNTKWYPQDCAM